MKKVNMETAIKRYNGIMETLGREHVTIGTRLSEGTENWNLRDMVSEMQYQLDFWNEPGTVPYDDAHDDSQPLCNGRKLWYANWVKEKKQMERFIDNYSRFIDDMECTTGHCSCYD